MSVSNNPPRTAHDRDQDGVDDRVEMLLAAALGIALMPVAQRVTAAAWRLVTGKPAPQGADDDWQVAVLWGAVAGAGAGIARTLASRQARAFARRRRS